jgi:hypothetical protein
VQVDLEGVAEALLHEGDAPVVGRPGRALAEPGELGDVRRQRLLGIARLLALRFHPRGREAEDQGRHRRPAKRALPHRPAVSPHVPP